MVVLMLLAAAEVISETGVAAPRKVDAQPSPQAAVEQVAPLTKTLPEQSLPAELAPPRTLRALLPSPARFLALLAGAALLAVAAAATYHRHLLRTRRGQSAPGWLGWLLPKPTNYEEQMSQLCRRYLDAPKAVATP